MTVKKYNKDKKNCILQKIVIFYFEILKISCEFNFISDNQTSAKLHAYKTIINL